CQHSKTLTSLITTQSILLKIYSLLVASETDFRNQKKTNPKIYFFLSSLHIFSCRAAALGGAKRDRTADLLRARQALSQLSYGPKTAASSNPPCQAAQADKQKANLVGLGGLEPPTSPLSGVRSNHLSYRPGKVSRAL